VISIGELAAATGVAPGTLRMWETRHGFPESVRGQGGHRRYQPDDVARVAQVVAARRHGLSLAAAIERARTWSPSAPPSLFAALRASQPELAPRRLPLRAMLAVSRAIEDECLARAARPVLLACFQTERAYRRAEGRWRALARTAAAAYVLADFARRRETPGGPVELPIAEASPVAREWAVVCLDARLTAGLTGWEQPGDAAPRCFEAIWTTDPAAVAATLRSGLELAGVPAGELPEAGDEAAAATLPLANRMVGYLVEALG
jgi:DNA-binding transcriptional MerR regulator